ncbi:MAG: hypothetical protein RI957_1311 [Verrucomicrobiota bacterium]
MDVLIKLLILLFILVWVVAGIAVFLKYGVNLSGSKNETCETSGSQTLNFTQMFLIWFGFLSLAVHFLFM